MVYRTDAASGFLRVHFEKLDKTTSVGYHFLFEGKSKSIKCAKDRAFVEQASNANYRSDKDYYITANSFKSTSERSASALYGLHNIVIDIDAHDGNIACSQAVESFLMRVHNDLPAFDEALPMPNSIVTTGRGCQLWWSFEPIAAKFLDVYQRVQAFFISKMEDFLAEFPSEFEHLALDLGASQNACGLYRMPGTANTKTGTVGSVEVLHTNHLNFFAIKKEQGLKKQPRRQHVGRKNRTAEELGRERAAALSRLQALRGEMTGQRDYLIWLYHNECLKFMPVKMAEAAAKEINARFPTPLNPSELKSAITTSPKIKSEAGIGYAVRNATIIDLLNITPEEQDKIGLHYPLLCSTPNKARDRKRARNKQQKKKRNRRILKLFVRGVSQLQLAARFRIDRKTVRSILKNAGILSIIAHWKEKRTLHAPLQNPAPCAFGGVGKNGSIVCIAYPQPAVPARDADPHPPTLQPPDMTPSEAYSSRLRKNG